MSFIFFNLKNIQFFRHPIIKKNKKRALMQVTIGGPVCRPNLYAGESWISDTYASESLQNCKLNDRKI